MRTVVLILGLIFAAFTANAQSQEGVTLTVTIENVLQDGGQVLVSLHNADTWMRGPGVVDTEKEGTKGEMVFTFENVQPGTYGVLILHDENGNRQMDFEDSGMPKESYGMSGNEMAMGPPTFEGAKFEVSAEDVDLRIRF